MRRLDPQSLTEHLDALHRAAWALCGSREDAEDLVQETFARVLARPRVIRGEERAYLMRALRNTFYSRVRTASRRPQTVAGLDDIEPPDRSVERRPERAAEVGEILAAIAELPEDFRMAIVAVDILGLSYGEAAAVLDAREATITARLYRARQRIARRFADSGPGKDDRDRIPVIRESGLMDEPMIDDPQHPEAELARLADGTLPADRETELRAELERSPQLTAALAEQQHAVALLRALDEPAPEALGGRRVVTVFYTGTGTGTGGGRIGYSIVSGTPLTTPAGAAETHYGVRFTLRAQDGARIVTWRNSGHTCVIAARSVSYGALVALAVADEQTSST